MDELKRMIRNAKMFTVSPMKIVILDVIISTQNDW